MWRDRKREYVHFYRDSIIELNLANLNLIFLKIILKNDENANWFY